MADIVAFLADRRLLPASRAAHVAEGRPNTTFGRVVTEAGCRMATTLADTAAHAEETAGREGKNRAMEPSECCVFKKQDD